MEIQWNQHRGRNLHKLHAHPTPRSPTRAAIPFLVTNPVGSVESSQAALTVVSTNWLAQSFGANFRTNASAALFANPDGDGVLNWQEYLRGQNPTDGAASSNRHRQLDTTADLYTAQIG